MASLIRLASGAIQLFAETSFPRGGEPFRDLSDNKQLLSIRALGSAPVLQPRAPPSESFFLFLSEDPYLQLSFVSVLLAQISLSLQSVFVQLCF